MGTVWEKLELDVRPCMTEQRAGCYLRLMQSPPGQPLPIQGAEQTTRVAPGDRIAELQVFSGE